MHALIATDGSAATTRALRAALRVLAVDEVTLLTVAPLELDDGAGGLEGPVLTADELEEMERAEEVAADADVARAASDIDGLLPPRAHTLVEHGEAGPVVCDVARRLGVDVVVVGAHDRGLVERALVGSTSNYVVRHAPCPVVVVRDRVVEEGDEAPEGVSPRSRRDP